MRYWIPFFIIGQVFLETLGLKFNLASRCPETSSSLVERPESCFMLAILRDGHHEVPFLFELLITHVLGYITSLKCLSYPVFVRISLGQVFVKSEFDKGLLDILLGDKTEKK